VIKAVEDIFEEASKKKLTLTMDSQWPFSIDDYQKVCGKIVVKKIEYVFIKMSLPFQEGR